MITSQRSSSEVAHSFSILANSAFRFSLASLSGGPLVAAFTRAVTSAIDSRMFASCPGTSSPRRGDFAWKPAAV